MYELIKTLTKTMYRDLYHIYHIYIRPKLLVSNEMNCCHGELNTEVFLTISISGKVKQALG